MKRDGRGMFDMLQRPEIVYYRIIELYFLAACQSNGLTNTMTDIKSKGLSLLLYGHYSCWLLI